MRLLLHCLLWMRRGSDAAADVPTQQGAEVEVFTEHTANGSYSAKGPHHPDVYSSDQGVLTGEYEVAAAGGQALMW